MNTSVTKLGALGTFIGSTRRRMGITEDLLCAEIKCSKSTYRKV